MSIQDIPPPYSYVAYIDEAGDPGIETVRPCDPHGASEWLVIGAVLIEAANEADAVTWRNHIIRASSIRSPTLHFRNLEEWQKLLVCQSLATFPLNVFAMLSNKKNMRGYTNPRAAARGNALTSKQTFYNFCLRLILERITDCVLRHSTRVYGEPRFVKIVFGKRGGHSYGHTFAYNDILKQQNRSRTTWLKKRELKWQVIHRLLQEAALTEEIAGLQLADIVASSFYQAVDILPPTIWNPANAKWLRPRVAKEAGLYEEYGVAFQPFPFMTQAKLLPQQKEIFEFYGFNTRDFDVPWYGNYDPWGKARRVPAPRSAVER